MVSYTTRHFVLTSEEVVIIDRGSSLAIDERVSARLKGVTMLPVVMIFNTPVLGDRWLGYPAFTESVVAQPVYGSTSLIERVAFIDNLAVGSAEDAKSVGPDNPVIDDDIGRVNSFATLEVEEHIF